MSPLQDEITFSLRPPTESQLLIYFVPGNPGLVEYYRDFLQQLHSTLPSSIAETTTIYGSSHCGFEVNSTTPTYPHSPPFSLAEVISSTKSKIARKAAELGNPKVILMGHSVGSYILLDILNSKDRTFNIAAEVCLFPTILHIAKSDKGRFFSRLLPLPFIPILAQALARLLSCIPTWLWNWPQTFTPGEKHVSHNAAVTEAMIRSTHGAKQTVFMAADEMVSIAEDKWRPESIWGATKTKTKLFFYWGEDDYWVDNGVRDALIAQRARREGDVKTEGWPEMVVDGERMDHCFSLTREHAGIVAGQVAEWVERLRIVSA